MVYQPAERPKGPLALPFLGGQVRPNILEVGGGYLPTKAEASYANGSGCMASDSGALALWGYLLFGGQLLSEKSLLAMTDFGNGFYGLGVYDQTKDGAWRGAGQSIGNAGWHAGGDSPALACRPSRGLSTPALYTPPAGPPGIVVPVAAELPSAPSVRPH